MRKKKILVMEVDAQMTELINKKLNEITGRHVLISEYETEEFDKMKELYELDSIIDPSMIVNIEDEKMDIDIEKIKTHLMKDFNSKVNQFGVRKFLREGFFNQATLYRIKNLDQTLSLEAIKRFHDKIIEIKEKELTNN
jgi:hypothetical protein